MGVGFARAILLLEGVFGVLAGIVTVAARAIVTGVFETIAAVRLRREIAGEWALILGGDVSVIFGLILAMPPGVGIPSRLWLIGIYAVVFGVLLIVLAFRIRRRATARGSGFNVIC